MTEFIKANWESFAFVIGFAVVILAMLKMGLTAQVNATLFSMVCDVEARFGAGTGLLKYNEVAMMIYAKLPAIALLFFTPKSIDKGIDSAVTKMKKWLQENEKARLLIEQGCMTIPKIVEMCEVPEAGTEEERK